MIEAFRADPSRARDQSGAAVDLTLVRSEHEKPVEMVGTMTRPLFAHIPTIPADSLQRWHRNLLRDAIEAEGFTVYEAEWWHFDYKDWQKYAIGNVVFDKLR